MDGNVRRLSERIAELEEENRQLRELLAPSDLAISSLPGVHMPRKEALLFACLRRHETISKAKAYASIWGGAIETDPKAIDVYIFRLREKLAPHGYAIETIHRQGYRLLYPAGSAEGRKPDRASAGVGRPAGAPSAREARQ